MAHIALETTINAPADVVFDLLRTPDQRPEWMINLHAVHNVTGNQVGDSWEYTYTMLGRSFTGLLVPAMLPPELRV